MTPPRYGGEFRGEFFMKNQGSEGIGGIFGFSADGDAPPPRYGGILGGSGGSKFGVHGGLGGESPPPRLERGYLRTLM